MPKTECEIKLTGGDKQNLEKAFEDISELMLPQSYKDSEINTLYYDDENATLYSQRKMLRYRTVDGRGYVCLKANAKITECSIVKRDEWEVKASNLSAGLGKIKQLGGREVEKTLKDCGKLINCASLSFNRKQMQIIYEKAVLEICLDKGVFDKEGAFVEFYEIEAELIDGSDEALASLLAHLQTKYGLWVEERSKYERAYTGIGRKRAKD